MADIRDDVSVDEKRAWLRAHAGETNIEVGLRGKLSKAAEEAYASRNPAPEGAHLT